MDTHWSVVLEAGQARSVEASHALETLCRMYWYPLYAYVRRRGYETYDAQDLTQDFFAHLLEHHAFEKVGPEKGRFRSFLLASMNHFLANEWDRARAQKRGGNCTFISLDDTSTEALYLVEPVSDSAEKTFDRRWAIALLDRALGRLKEECRAAGKGALFEKLKGFIPEEPSAGEYEQAGAQLGWKRSALAVAVHRLRQRFRELVREEVAHTVRKADEVDAELSELLAALR